MKTALILLLFLAQFVLLVLECLAGLLLFVGGWLCLVAFRCLQVLPVLRVLIIRRA